MPLHKALNPGDIHPIHNFEYADAAARTGASVTSDDIGRVALQQDTDTFYLLKDTTPTWVEIGGGGEAVQTSREHYIQHSNAIATIRKDLDGYASAVDLSGEIATQSEHYVQRSETIKTILKDLDGYGDVNKVGTPVNNQIGVWTGDGTLEGDSLLTWNGTDLVISGSAASGGIDINNTATTGDPKIAFQLSGTTAFAMGVDDSDGDYFKIGTTAIDVSTFFIADSTGRISLGPDAAINNEFDFNWNQNGLTRFAVTNTTGGTNSRTDIRVANDDAAIVISSYSSSNTEGIVSMPTEGLSFLEGSGIGGLVISTWATSYTPIVFAIRREPKMILSSLGNLGIGTQGPHERLTVNGRIALQTGSAPGAEHDVDGYGTLYIDKSDDKLYYQYFDTAAVELGADVGGVTSAQGSDGYIAFFTGPDAIAGDNDLFYNRESSVLSVGGDGKIIIGDSGQIASDQLTIVRQGFTSMFNKAYGNDQNDIPKFSFLKSRGTIASPLAVTDTTKLWLLRVFGQTGASTSGTAFSISVEASQNWGTTAFGTNVIFSTGKTSTNTIIEVMRFDGSQRVGIGATSPSDLLDVEVDATGGIEINATAGNPTLTLQTNGTTDFTMGIDSGDSDKFKISSGSALGTNDAIVIDDASSPDRIGFFNSAPTTEFDMTVSKDGSLVGLIKNTSTGTGSGVFFGIRNQDNSNMRMAIFSSTHSGTFGPYDRQDSGYLQYDGDSKMIFMASNAVPMHFVTNSLQAMTINRDQNVGIGTELPHEKLTINGFISLQEQDNYDRTHDGYGSLWAKSDGTLHFTDDSGTDTDLTDSGGGGEAAQTSREHYIQHSNAISTIRKDLDGYGDVTKVGTPVNNQLGIWTGNGTIEGDSNLTWDAPGGMLAMSGNAATSGITINNIAANGDPTIAFQLSGTSKYTIGVDDDNDYFKIGTTAIDTNTMFIMDSTGRISMGPNAAINNEFDFNWDQNGITRFAISNATSGISARADIRISSDTHGILMSAYSAISTETIGSIPAEGVSNIETNSTNGLVISTVKAIPILFAIARSPTMTISSIGHIGLGTQLPHEMLTVNGIISLQEQDAFDRTHDGYGSLWAKSDGTLHFTDDSGTDTDLTDSGGGGGAAITGTPADGYLAFFTDSGTIAGDNDLYYDRVDNALHVSKIVSPNLEVDGYITIGGDGYEHPPAALFVAHKYDGYASEDSMATGVYSNTVGPSGTRWLAQDFSPTSDWIKRIGAFVQMDITNGLVRFAIAPRLSSPIDRDAPDITNYIWTSEIITPTPSLQRYDFDVNIPVTPGGQYFLVISYLTGYRGSNIPGVSGRSFIGTGPELVNWPSGRLRSGGTHGAPDDWGKTASTMAIYVLEKKRIGNDPSGIFEGSVGIGTHYPHEALTLNGVVSLQEQGSYGRTHDGYGSLYAKSNGLYYKGDNTDEIKVSVNHEIRNSTLTGETWNDRDIYRSFVDFGAGPDKTTKAVTSGIPAGDGYVIVGIKVIANNLHSGFGSDGYNDITVFNKIDQKVYFTSEADRSIYDYEVAVDYLKPILDPFYAEELWDSTIQAEAQSGGRGPAIIVTVSLSDPGPRVPSFMGLTPGVHMVYPNNLYASWSRQIVGTSTGESWWAKGPGGIANADGGDGFIAAYMYRDSSSLTVYSRFSFGVGVHSASDGSTSSYQLQLVNDSSVGSANWYNFSGQDIRNFRRLQDRIFNVQNYDMKGFRLSFARASNWESYTYA